MPAHIKISYEIVTPESATQGDFAETGWDNEEGLNMEPDKFDRGMTRVDLAVKILKYQGATPSSTHFHVGVWYLEGDVDIDHRTGAETRQSYHLYDFTEAEEREIFNRMTG